jgi:hypothetical protein
LCAEYLSSISHKVEPGVAVIVFSWIAFQLARYEYVRPLIALPMPFFRLIVCVICDTDVQFSLADRPRNGLVWSCDTTATLRGGEATFVYK